MSKPIMTDFNNPFFSTTTGEAERWSVLKDRQPNKSVMFHHLQEYDGQRIIKVKTIDNKVVSKVVDDRELILFPEDKETIHYQNILNAYHKPPTQITL